MPSYVSSLLLNLYSWFLFSKYVPVKVLRILKQIEFCVFDNERWLGKGILLTASPVMGTPLILYLMK
jgi:hypothetical protein